MIPWKTRFVTLSAGDEPRNLAQVQVNIAYERDMLARPMTPPPVLTMEGYSTDVPAVDKEEVVAAVTGGPSGSRMKGVKRRSDGGEVQQQKRTLRAPAPEIVVEEKPYYQEWDSGYVNLQESSNYEENYVEDFEDGNQPECSQDSNRPAKIQMTSFCRICQVNVLQQWRRRHIYVKHLRKKIYKCPFCDSGHLYHKGNIEQHIRKAHNSRMKPISHKEEYTAAVDVWMYKCFSDRRLFRFIEPDVVHTVNNLVDWCCAGLSVPPCDPPSVNQSFFDQLPEQLLETETVEEPSPPLAVPPVPPAPKVITVGGKTKIRNPLTCRLCGMSNLRHLERHVLQYHLKRAMFLCPFCQYSNNYAMNAVKDHIRTKHSTLPDQEMIDLRSEHWQDIRRMHEQCFMPEHVPYQSQTPMFYPVWNPPIARL